MIATCFYFLANLVAANLVLLGVLQVFEVEYDIAFMVLELEVQSKFAPLPSRAE